MHKMHYTISRDEFPAKIEALKLRIRGGHLIEPDAVAELIAAIDECGPDWRERTRLLRADLKAGVALSEMGKHQLLRFANHCWDIRAMLKLGWSTTPRVPSSPRPSEQPRSVAPQDVAVESAPSLVCTRVLRSHQLSCRASSINLQSRSLVAVIATENPVPVFDEQQGRTVAEVLKADGLTASQLVPLLDCHQRKSMDDLRGSVRDIRTEGREVVGRLHFASDPKSLKAWQQYVEGHATDVSAGYQVIVRQYVPDGKSAVIGGRSYTGPVNVVTLWRLREVSVVPIGADELAKARQQAG